MLQNGVFFGFSFYLVGILAPLFTVVWLSILALYYQIWREAKTHAERWKQNGFVHFDSSHRKSNQVLYLYRPAPTTMY